MAEGLRAKLKKVVTSREHGTTVRSIKRPHCETGKNRSGAKCVRGANKEAVTSVGD